ncbi:hypothetical protein IIY_05737 [Bacillus cereus VD140]|nr:hypothetical protein IIY_05737 [Bacillus cereus VD140]
MLGRSEYSSSWSEDKIESPPIDLITNLILVSVNRIISK